MRSHSAGEGTQTRAIAGLVLIALVAFACTSAPSPSSEIRAFGDAILDGDLDAAWSLTGDSYVDSYPDVDVSIPELDGLDRRPRATLAFSRRHFDATFGAITTLDYDESSFAAVARMTRSDGATFRTVLRAGDTWIRPASRPISLHITYGDTSLTRPTTVFIDGVPMPVEFHVGQTFSGVILRAELETFDASHVIAVEFEDGTRVQTLVEDEPEGGPRGQTSTPADVFVNLTDGMEAATIRAVLNHKNWGTPSP